MKSLNSDADRILKNKSPKRRRLFSVRLAGVPAILIWTALFGFSSCRKITSQAAPPAAAGSFTIFQGTMADMTWPDVEKAARDGAIVLMTTAVIEEHGPHMTCGIDAYLGYLMCRLTHQELEGRGIKTVIAPPLYWGINRSSHVFAGTFTVRPETMKALLHDILASLKSMGFRDIFNINAHGDGLHIRTAIEGLIESRKNLNLNIRYLMSEEDAKRSGMTGNEPFFLVHKTPPTGLGSQEYLDLHAGAWETGIVAAYFPEQVNVTVARTLEPTRVKRDRITEWINNMRKVTPQGYLGDPASFDARQAKTYMEANCRMMADAIEAFMRQNK